MTKKPEVHTTEYVCEMLILISEIANNVMKNAELILKQISWRVWLRKIAVMSQSVFWLGWIGNLRLRLHRPYNSIIV